MRSTLTLAISLLVLLATLGCDEEEPVRSTTGNGPTGSTGYRLESQPSLSPDGNYVYYIARDTADASRSGLWRAAVVAPEREELYNGTTLSSPSASPDGNTVALLNSSAISYYEISQGRLRRSSVAAVFEALVMLNEDQLIGERGDSLFLVTESEATVEFVARGYDPTFVTADTFLYLVPMAGYAYGLVRSGLPEMEPDTIYYVVTADWSGVIRWAHLWNSNGRLVWAHEISNVNTIFTGQVPFSEPLPIDISSTSKPCIISQFLIIFTGPDGRFWKSDFDDSGIWPFWDEAGDN
jgi:hypothetical protein